MFKVGIKSNYGGFDFCKDGYFFKEIYLKLYYCLDFKNIDKFISNILIVNNLVRGMSI